MKMKHRGSEPVVVKGREGYKYILSNNKKLIDLSGGTLAQTLSNTEKILGNENIRDKKYFLPSYGFSTKEIEETEKRIIELVSDEYSDIIWASSGSDAVEIACSLLEEMFKEEKGYLSNQYVIRDKEFHGNTFLANTLSRRSYKSGNLLGKNKRQIVIPQPKCRKCVYVKKCQAQCIKKLELGRIIKQNESVNGVILEPVPITGDTLNIGVKYYEELISKFTKNDIPIVFDEILSGCYRCGDLSYSKYLNNKPDIILLSKGLTAGLYPISAVILKLGFVKKYSKLSKFRYGHTYGITPLAEHIVRNVMDRHIELKNKGRLKNICDMIKKIAEKKVKPNESKYVIDYYKTIMRIGILDRTLLAKFREYLKKRNIYIYNTIQRIDARTEATYFIVAPYYDCELKKMYKILSDILENIEKNSK